MGDEHWMRLAIAEAEGALLRGEVPIAALVVHRGAVTGKGCNRVEESGIPFEHAELVALRNAAGARGRWALAESVLYVTVEPCIMCVGAMVLARVPRLVFGAREPRTGACESILAIPADPAVEHRISAVGGIEADRCSELMQTFFRNRRSTEREGGGRL